MIRRLLIAAAVALVAGPAFTLYHACKIELRAARSVQSIGLGATAVTLEPLLPSGHF